MGLHQKASYFSICLYYLVGLPLAVVLGILLGWGVMGLQVGIFTAVILLSLAFTVIVVRSDWQGIAD